MDIQSPMTRHDTLAHVVGDTARSLSERRGEPEQRRAERTRSATGMIMAFRPADVIEAMIASHCVMFHELIVDSVHNTLSGEDPAARRPAQSNIVAMDKAFGNNLARLEAYRTRRAEASPDVQPVPARDETDISDRIRRHQACAPAPIVERQTGSETMADPARFARPAGEGERTAASVQISGSNGHSVVNPVLTQRSIYAGNRQARRHPNP